MIFDWSFRHGLVFGLEHQPILGFDESIGDAFEASSVVLHLGPLEMRMIFGVERSDDE